MNNRKFENCNFLKRQRSENLKSETVKALAIGILIFFDVTDSKFWNRWPLKEDDDAIGKGGSEMARQRDRGAVGQRGGGFSGKRTRLVCPVLFLIQWRLGEKSRLSDALCPLHSYTDRQQVREALGSGTERQWGDERVKQCMVQLPTRQYSDVVCNKALF